MSLLALTLVLASASLHAVWNLFAKNVSGGIVFVWMFSALATAVYAPVLAISIVQNPIHFSLGGLLFLGGTCLLHIFYYWLLNQGYRVGDLSLVYPLARGSGPLFATVGAVLLLGERPSWIAIMGTLLIAASVVSLTGDPRKLRAAGIHGAVAYSIFTGVVIAAYTLWDKEAVSVVLITPLLLNWASSLTRTVLLAPFAIRQKDEVRRLWQKHWREALGVAVLDPLSYILFLTALSFSQVSYLAPMRQLSILIAALIGARFLAEDQARRRLISVAAMTVGLIILTFG